ncbi:uracil DNA N-glycosylase [Trichosporon asahii var. asahii CBS 8904]|uniref:Uracil-DNA glycosylase n=2 Tax=Trichosporon asahii var. asahii TaxID=189963 RepID=K1VK12_TRIAC|nr:uracil DNA N-glycosylase [Trichosporon asahii var. asahii CBS 2479]EJT46771.1 uracil DNA N-glycosylase [Trichosporon asahii var. asahii CBS 2479]EKD04500.1 uracil DNA N-glycosylase [Trichosporon asahii var. asahii CBS 8904]
MPPKSIASYFKPAGAAATKSSTRATGSALSDAARDAIMKAKDLNQEVPSPRPAKKAKIANEPVASTEDIYSWSRFCPLKDVRIVIVGQDPYHGPGQAHGLAFSVKRGVAIPPSLRNMYKEMTTAIPGFVAPKHGDLTEWAKHGVLLLNTSLTVRASEAGSHAGKGWEQFTAAVMKVVTSRLAGSASGVAVTATADAPGSSANGIVLMAWGAHAQKMIAGLDTKRHLVLKSAHPSPLSASRGFFGNGHFVKSNAWLQERYGADGGIDWKSLGEPAP